MTLVELVVTLTLLLLVVGIFVSIMASVQQGLEREVDRSNDNDQARLAIEEIDREIRSGNVLYDPGNAAYLPSGIPGGMGMLVYTQTYANIRDPGNQCVQWKIDQATKTLQRRAWATGNPGGVTAWRIVAENIVNRDAPTVTAFALDTDPQKGSRIVNVTLVVRTSVRSGLNTVRVASSISGRNTSYGYPLNVCSTIPSG
jgi:hypothetical protein